MNPLASKSLALEPNEILSKPQPNHNTTVWVEVGNNDVWWYKSYMWCKYIVSVTVGSDSYTRLNKWQLETDHKKTDGISDKLLLITLV